MSPSKSHQHIGTVKKELSIHYQKTIKDTN